MNYRDIDKKKTNEESETKKKIDAVSNSIIVVGLLLGKCIHNNCVENSIQFVWRMISMLISPLPLILHIFA